MTDKPFRVTWRTNKPEPTGWVEWGKASVNPVQYSYFSTVEDTYTFMELSIRAKGYVGVPYWINDAGYWIPLPQTQEEYWDEFESDL